MNAPNKQPNRAARVSKRFLAKGCFLSAHCVSFVRSSGFSLSLLCCAALLFSFGTTAARAAATASEAEVKAAFLYNFVKFVEWPTNAFASETNAIQVAVFGDDEMTGKLKVLLSDKKAHGRPFDVKRVFNPQEAKNFQVVFITASESKRALLILDAVKKLPILTVGETEEFLDSGGMINFVFEDTQLRFEINPEPAEKVKLTISSKLLRLAKKRSVK